MKVVLSPSAQQDPFAAAAAIAAKTAASLSNQLGGKVVEQGGPSFGSGVSFPWGINGKVGIRATVASMVTEQLKTEE